MTVNILSDDFKLKCVLDEIIYLKYSERLCRAGYAYLTIPFKKESYDALKPPCRLLIEDMPYTVEKIKCSPTTIDVYARSIFHDFRHFVIGAPRKFTGKHADMVYTLASEVSFKGVDYRVYGITDTGDSQSDRVEWDTSYEDAITRLCQADNLYFRIIYDATSRELRFLIDKRVDRAVSNPLGYLTVSDKTEPFLDIEVTRDMSEYKTRIEFLYYINQAIGHQSIVFDKTPQNELPRTCSEIPPIVGNTHEEYQTLLNKRAEEVFEKHVKHHQIRVRIRGKGEYKVGQLCLFESTLLGETHRVVITKREHSYNRGREYEELTLEVI